MRYRLSEHARKKMAQRGINEALVARTL